MSNPRDLAVIEAAEAWALEAKRRFEIEAAEEQNQHPLTRALIAAVNARRFLVDTPADEIL